MFDFFYQQFNISTTHEAMTPLNCDTIAVSSAPKLCIFMERERVFKNLLKVKLYPNL